MGRFVGSSADILVNWLVIDEFRYVKSLEFRWRNLFAIACCHFRDMRRFVFREVCQFGLSTERGEIIENGPAGETPC